MYIYVLQGLINDPDLDGTHNIKKGIRLARYTQIVLLLFHTTSKGRSARQFVCIHIYAHILKSTLLREH